MFQWINHQKKSCSFCNHNFCLPTQIYYYADSIYATAGVKPNDIQYVTVGTGAVNVFMTIAAVGALIGCC